MLFIACSVFAISPQASELLRKARVYLDSGNIKTAENYYRKIQSLNEEIEELKKLLDNNQEEEEAKSVQTEEKNMKIRVETSKYETRTYQRPTGRSASQGIARVVRRSNEPVNVVVRTTKISYRRRNEG